MFRARLLWMLAFYHVLYGAWSPFNCLRLLDLLEKEMFKVPKLAWYAWGYDRRMLEAKDEET